MTKKILALLLALMMAFTLAACGGGGDTEPEADDPPAAADDAGGEPVDDAEDEAVDETGGDMEDLSSWTCYMGVMDDESTIYYAFDETGTRGAIIVLSPDYTQSISVIGDVGSDVENDLYSVTDDNTGLMITFGAYDNGDGSWELDFGNLGTAVVAESDPQEVLNAMDTIREGTTDITEDFIASLG